ncbi:MAG: hypothetical protein AAF004_04570 [Pseudomonadota bacterium]
MPQSTTTKTAVVITALIAAIFTLWFALRADTPTAASSPDAVGDTHPASTPAPSNTPAPEPQPTRVADVEASRVEDAPAPVDCIDERNNPFDHPIIAAELKRLAPILPMGPEFEVFRGVDRNAVRSLAIQGDSAAMYILAKMYLNSARGLPDSRVYQDVLDFQQPYQSRRRYERNEVSEEQRNEDQAAAREWLKTAAVHGRLFALMELGFLEQQAGETIVSKQWISQEAFDALEPDTQRIATVPGVYIAMADLLVPELATGIGGALREKEIAIDKLGSLAVIAADEFMADVTAAGQTLPRIEPSTGPDWETIKGRFCDHALVN